jgi:hypothetical protein
MVPLETTLEDGELVDRADTVAASGEFRADLIPVGDIRKAEQLATNLDFAMKVGAVFGPNVVDERATVDEVVFSEH